MKKTIAIWISMLSIYAYSDTVPSAAPQPTQPQQVVAGVQTNPQGQQPAPNKANNAPANEDPAEDMDDDEIILDDDNSDDSYDYDDNDDDEYIEDDDGDDIE